MCPIRQKQCTKSAMTGVLGQLQIYGDISKVLENTCYSNVKTCVCM